MTIRHLEIFIAVAESGKMRQAAKDLYISQPTVSQAIAEIESYYGVKLFERLSKKLYITEQGEKLLVKARYILDSFRQMEQELKEEGGYPSIRIGASVTVGTCLIGDCIKKFELECPNVKTKVIINNTSTIEEMVLKNGLDLALIEGETVSTELIKLPVFEDKLVLVCGRSHPFVNRSDIRIEDLEGQDFIAREEGSVMRNLLEQLLREHGIYVNHRWSSTNTEAIKQAVKDGFGLAILSNLLVKDELENETMRIVPISDINLERTIHLVYHKDKYLSDPIRELIRICKDMKGV